MPIAAGLLLRAVGDEEVLEARRLLLPGQRVDVPDQPGAVVMFATEPTGDAVENRGKLAKGQPPEDRRVLTGLNPRLKQRKRL